jgi:uncharacterized damage-inducible protein DinB
MATIQSEQIKNLLESGHAFAKPQHILANLEPALAVTVPTGAVHSIASHVAHMTWWLRQALHHIEARAQEWQRIEGDEFPIKIAAADWEGIRQAFFEQLESFQALCDDEALLERGYVSGKNTIGYVLLDYAIHNAYHLGQIVLLRRLLGAWTPETPGSNP